MASPGCECRPDDVLAVRCGGERTACSASDIAGRTCLFLSSGFFMAIIVVIVYFLWFVPDGPLDPTFRLRDFVVSNFSMSASRPGLSATFEANLTVVNPNSRTTYDLANIYSFVYYKDTGDGVLSLNSVEPPLNLDENSTASITVRTSRPESDWLIAHAFEALHRDLWRTGAVTFNLGIHFTQTSSLDPDYHVLRTIYCKRMKVAMQFSGGIGFGALSLPVNNRNGEVSCRASSCDGYYDKTAPYC